jgi:DNA-binding CsgD family transcriptional regulator
VRTGSAALAIAHEMLRTSRAAPCLLAELALRCAQVAHDLGDDRAAGEFLDVCRTAWLQLDDRGTIATRADELRERIAHIDPRIALLTPAERRVLQHLGGHWSLVEIADHLYVSRTTVKSHVASVYRKLGVDCRSDAVAMLGDRAATVDEDWRAEPADGECAVQPHVW